jgi:basic membrane protein A and related proteins
MTKTLLFWLAFVSLSLQAAPLKVGLVLDKGGRDDKSFNAAAFLGSQEAEKKLGVPVKVVEVSDDTAIEPSLRTFAKKGFDLIIAIGFVMGSSVEKVAKDFPAVQFAVVDSTVDLPNVQSINFEEQEGSYLVGAIAALTSKTKTVGFIGGMDIPLIRRFELGFKSGAQAAVPGTTVLSNYVGTSSDSWKNPTKAKELALSQYQKKADVIFHAAGASGLGLFDAAEETKKFAIGCDSNQNWVKPGRILTSMTKRVDVAVYEAIETKKAGQFKPGKRVLGIAQGGVDFAIDDNNKALIPAEVLKKVEALKSQIAKKTLVVPDYYKKTNTKS